MSLVNFGDFAVEWTRVFMINVREQTTDGLNAKTVEVFADIPGAEPQKVFATLNGATAANVWSYAKQQEKLLFVEASKRKIAIERSFVAAVALFDDMAAVTFCLGGNRPATISFPLDVVSAILAQIPSA